MSAPRTETIAVRFTEHEHSLLERLAALRGLTVSDVVRELIGFERQQASPRRRHLELVPTRRGGGRRRPASPGSCLTADDLRHPLVAHPRNPGYSDHR
jgi:hypothetical protein